MSAEMGPPQTLAEPAAELETVAMTSTAVPSEPRVGSAERLGAGARRGHGRFSRLSAEMMLVAIVLLWSGSYTASRYAVTHGFEPVAFSALRFAIGAAVFVLIVLIREGSLRVSRRDLLYVAPAALIGIVVNQVTFQYSISLTEASTVALIFGTLPIFASVLTRLLGWQQLSARHWLATGVSFGGVALVALGVGGQLSADLGGVILAILAAASFAAFSVFVGPLMRRHSPYRVSAVVVLAGTIPLLAIASPQIAHLEWTRVDPLAWVAFAYIVLMFITTTYLWFIALDRVGAPQATLWANLQPFIGAIFAIIILSEGLGPLQIVGGLVIAASIAISRARRHPTPPTIT